MSLLSTAEIVVTNAVALNEHHVVQEAPGTPDDYDVVAFSQCWLASSALSNRLTRRAQGGVSGRSPTSLAFQVSELMKDGLHLGGWRQADSSKSVHDGHTPPSPTSVMSQGVDACRKTLWTGQRPLSSW